MADTGPSKASVWAGYLFVIGFISLLFWAIDTYPDTMQMILFAPVGLALLYLVWSL